MVATDGINAPKITQWRCSQRPKTQSYVPFKRRLTQKSCSVSGIKDLFQRTVPSEP